MRLRRILIADDNEAFVTMASTRCRALGLDVRSAPDAMMALVRIHKDPPDILLLDINLPAGNGLCALQMIRSDPRLADIPVIVCSGQCDDETRERCTQLGAVYVSKSAHTWRSLQAEIRKILTRPAGRRREADGPQWNVVGAEQPMWPAQTSPV